MITPAAPAAPAMLSVPIDALPNGPAVERPHRSFVFGRFTLQPERQLLLEDEVPVRIGGRALDILTALVERAGDLLSKQELLSRTWPDTFVEESNLKVNMANLRRILGERPSDPLFIATVVGRGYRFVAPVKAFGQMRPRIALAPAPARPGGWGGHAAMFGSPYRLSFAQMPVYAG